jgi:hypothetical protein
VFLFLPLAEFWRTLLASTIGLLTLAGIMTRPFRGTHDWKQSDRRSKCRT